LMKKDLYKQIQAVFYDNIVVLIIK